MKHESPEVRYFQGVPYRVIYRHVKYPRLEFFTGILHLILPMGKDPVEILRKKKRWIHQKYQVIQRAHQEASRLPLVNRSFSEFRQAVNRFVQEAEQAFGVEVPRIQIRKMRTKWGSCSKRGTITINRLAQYLPDDLLRYLVFHEVNHRKHWRHDRSFWKELSKRVNQPEKREELLSLYWFRIVGDRHS